MRSDSSGTLAWCAVPPAERRHWLSEPPLRCTDQAMKARQKAIASYQVAWLRESHGGGGGTGAWHTVGGQRDQEGRKEPSTMGWWRKSEVGVGSVGLSG